MHPRTLVPLWGLMLIALSACGNQSANPSSVSDPALDEPIRYVPGENHFVCSFPADLGYGSITSADAPEAKVEIHSEYAVLSNLIYGSNDTSAESGEAASAEPLSGPQPSYVNNRVWQEFRFSNLSACQIYEELPASEVSPPEPGENYLSMAYGELDEAWSCADFERGRLNASIDNSDVAEDAIRERMAAADCDPWRVREDTSAMTDDVSVMITTYSDSYFGRYNDFRRATLVLRCSENTSAVFVNFNESLGNDGSYNNPGKNVLVRIGDAAANEQFWSTSTSREAIGLWRGGGSIPFMRQLTSAETLRLRVTPDRRNPMEVLFYTNRLREHLPKLASACGWDFEASE